jgi:hypothetical protein
MCRLLCDEFDVTPEQCGRDVLTFLDILAEKDLIVVSNGS